MTALLLLALLLPEHGGKHLMEMAQHSRLLRGTIQQPMASTPVAPSIMPPVITNAPRAIVRPPSTNWIVRPFKVLLGGTNLYRLDKSTDLGKTWTLIRSNLTGTASTTNYDVWDADRLPNVWYRLERQSKFYQFQIP